MNKIICINPPKFIKAILKFFSSFKKKDADKHWFKLKISYIRNRAVKRYLYNEKKPSFVGRLDFVATIYQKQKLRTVNFAWTETTRANVLIFNSAGRSVDFDFLDVGSPTASGLSVAVADCVAAHSAFSAYTTNSGHITVPPNLNDSYSNKYQRDLQLICTKFVI